MKDGALEQRDTPDRIVMKPATEYVRKFTEDVEKARVVHASALARPIDGTAPEGEAIDGAATIQDLARSLVNDPRAVIPVADKSGALIGALNRSDALDVLLGAD